jgi:hypothetical protein
VCGPSNEDVGRVWAKVRSAFASGSENAIEIVQTPSMKIQHHALKVILKYALIICAKASI